MTLNAFRNVSGDIVFPGFANFFTQQTSFNYAESTSAIYNDGLIENNLALQTQTGSNQVQSTNGSTIYSGSGNATTNIFNQLNSSLLGGNSVSILLRVHGSWLGEVFGMPEGMSLMSGNNGYYYISDTSFGNRGEASFGVQASNTAAIYNDVSLTSVTGNNFITGVNDASITTGNAYVGANLVNIANANVIGRNWTLAILNIFGDFDGNISFGQPDLWVGEQVAAPSTILNGSELTYVFSVINNGDAPATNIKLNETYDAAYLEIIDASLPYTKSNENTLLWEVGTLAPGEATEVSYRARVINTISGTNITNTVNVTLRETDGNYIDNTDTATVQTTQVTRISSSGGRSTVRQQSTIENKEATDEQTFEKLEVNRVTSKIVLAIEENETAQELIVRNNENVYLKDVVLTDILYGPDGLLIREEVWELGDVLPYEEITLRYEMAFTKTAALGMYKLATVVTGAEGSEKRYANNGQIELYTQRVAEDLALEIPVLGFAKLNSTPQPTVLGASNVVSDDASTDSDEILLTSPFSTLIAYAASNDDALQMLGIIPSKLYPLLVLAMILLVYWLYRYSKRSRSKLSI